MPTADPANNTTTTETKKKSIPVIAVGAKPHLVIYAVHEFNQARNALRWTRGTKLFEVLEDLLQDPADQRFWTMPEPAPAAPVRMYLILR